MKKVTCYISKKEFPADQCYRLYSLRDSLASLIRQDYPDIPIDSYISIQEIIAYRKKYLTRLVADESGEIDQIQQEVIDAIHNNKLLSENIEPELDDKLSLGQRVADNIATFGGSWTFITFFFLFLFAWMAVNIWLLTAKPFDPYPFILLNLILSCIAAIQAPIIMMSQNRMEQKDRLRNEHDYQVNLKAELEIQMLNEKMDHLLAHQTIRMMEIQQIQTDYLEDITKEIKKMMPDQK